MADPATLYGAQDFRETVGSMSADQWVSLRTRKGDIASQTPSPRRRQRSPKS